MSVNRSYNVSAGNMGRKCAVNECQGYVVFKFPSKSETKQLWLRRIGKAGLVCHKNAGLCAIHFKDEDFVTESHATGKGDDVLCVYM